MELTLDEALQKGIQAHKAGQIEEADRLYTAILKAQPKHPDANHNMGILAVGVDKVQESLPFFITALESKPSVGQYWLSYLDALIQLNQMADAQSVLDQAKGKGAQGEAFEQLENRLNELNKTQVKADPQIDDQNQVSPNILDNLELGQAIRLAQRKSKDGSSKDAKHIYNDILTKFPKNKKALDGIKSLSGRFIGEASKVQDPPQHQLQPLVNLCQQGQFQQALDSAKQLLLKFPNSLTLYNIQGASNSGLGQLKAAIGSYKKAIKINPDHADTYNNMGVTLKNTGDLGAAIDSYKKAIKINPNYADAYNNMGVALKDKGDLGAAINGYKQAIKIKPDYVEAYNNMGNALFSKGDQKAAIDSFAWALKIAPSHAKTHFNLGMLLLEMSHFKEATEHFKFGHKNSQYYLLKCLYLQDERSLFFDQLDYLIDQDEIHPIIGSLVCRSAIKYGLERPNLFCKDPLDYVLHIDLCNQYNFEKIFVVTARTILQENRVPKKIQPLLVNGYQTAGNVFNLNSHLTEEIQKIIRLEIDKYLVRFKNSNQGLITSWPADYGIHGWLVSMNSGGELQPHMHEKGWISGSIYISVPKKLRNNSGNLVVCIGDDQISEKDINQEKSIDVVTGSLCLFPSSLLHYTIPFKSEEERIVLAFDVVPKR